MREPIDKNYSILGNDTKPEPGIRYTLPDGSTTIWLNEYVDGMVQTERERIIKLIEDNLEDIPHEGLCFKGEFKTGYIAKVYSLVELIKGSNNNQ
jgi:hypothetical protein